MLKPNDRQSGLNELFSVARRDVPTAALQSKIHESVLVRLRDGVVLPEEFPASTHAPISLVQHPWFWVGLTTGAIALLAIAGYGWHKHTVAEQLQRHTRDSTVITAPPSLPETVTPSAEEINQPRPVEPVEGVAPVSSTLTSARPMAERVHGAAPVSKPSEAALIEQAHRALTSDPARALSLTETHRRLYPRGVLAEEREVIAIDALARVGRQKDAQKRGSDFRSKQPHSVHDLRLNPVLGGGGAGGKP